MTTTYTNPVYPHYMADPFVLQHDGRYFAYGTSPETFDGHVFAILESDDLITWQPRGGALIPSAGDEFWAPEVAHHDGTFYMYYSARRADEPHHRLRVATSDSPLGPFMDRDKLLVPDQPFSIDPHPFRDSNGDWYLFYSQDWLTLDAPWRVGTGIVVDRLIDMMTLAGDPRVVVRPHADWQIYEAGRALYDQVYDWHTIEGAATLLHNGRYYCFYSGGAWQNPNYGIAYVVADHALGPYRAPDESTPLMTTVAGQVIGPGHHSFTRSPDGEESVIIYHAWDAAMTARLMRVDRFSWNGDTPIIHGPTYTPQPAFSPNGKI